MLKINLLQGVERFLVERAKNNTRDFSHFHPSSWAECRRKIAYQYYEAKGIIKIQDEALKINPQLERIFDNGNYVHSRWGNYLRNAVPGALYGRWKCSNWMAHREPMIYGLDRKLGCPEPQKCECGSTHFEYVEIGFYDEETMLGGRVDAIVDSVVWNEGMIGRCLPKVDEVDRLIVVGISEYPPAQEENLAIFDYKSMNHHQLSKLITPLPKHVMQIQLYMFLSGLKNSKFLYEDKSDQSVKELPVERDDDLIQNEQKEAKELKVQLTTLNSGGQHVLPPRGYDSRGHRTCLQCKFRGHCWR